LKIFVFWDVTPFGLVDVYWLFIEICYFHKMYRWSLWSRQHAQFFRPHDVKHWKREDCV